MTAEKELQKPKRFCSSTQAVTHGCGLVEKYSFKNLIHPGQSEERCCHTEL